MPKKPKSILTRQAININGTVNGQIAIGNNNIQSQSGPNNLIAMAEMEELHRMLSELRAKVKSTPDLQNRTSALEQVQKLEQAVTAKKPDLSKMEKVKKKWFSRNAPTLVGVVTSVIVHPIVGKLVEAGGDLFVKEFQEKFGGSS